MTASARRVAERVVRVLQDAGHVAYFAGGCVRDELLGLHPNDFDVATDATPDRVASLFKGAREVGRAFGVMIVRLTGVTVEVTTFRREGVYTDRRRPDSIAFADAESDALRRDFTINALFLDPLAPGGTEAKGRIIDFVGGRLDLSRRLIRAVGEPEARLAEDNLRALRAVRFAARLGFTIEPGTLDAIRRHARDLAGVSRERIGEEVRMMLASPTRAEALRLIEELTLDGPVLEEPGALDRRGAARVDALRALGVEADPGLCLAAWALDRADQPPAEHLAALAQTVANRWRNALCLSNDERDRLASLLTGLAAVEHRWAASGVAEQKRTASAPWFQGVLQLLRHRDPALAHRVLDRVEALRATPGGLSPEPLVTGDLLVASGFSPGPRFGRWLDRVYDEQLEGRVRTPEEGLAFVRRLEAGAKE